MSLVLVTPPGSGTEPLSVADARAMLGWGSEVSDAVVGAFITSARQMIDGSTGWISRCLITQTWDLILDGFPWQDYYSLEGNKGFYPRPSSLNGSELRHHQRQGIVLPLAPVQSIVSIGYLDGAGVAQTLDPANYALIEGEPGRVVQSFAGAWPGASIVPGSVRVRFIAGYGDDPTDVPQPLRTAIAMQASHLRSLTARNLFISGETVEGVGSTNYTVGGGAGAAVSQVVESLLAPYRMMLP